MQRKYNDFVLPLTTRNHKGKKMFEQVLYFASFEELQKNVTDGRYLLVVAEKSDFPFEMLKNLPPLVGAIFPRIVFEQQSYDKGFILAKLNKNTSAFIVEEMDKDFSAQDLEKLNSFFLIVDGLSSHIGSFLEKFFEEIKEDAKFIGGGAGKLTLVQESVIFSNHFQAQDAAIIVGSYDYIGVGVKHGWKEIQGPFMATQTQKCVLQKINYVNAFDFYKEVVEKDCGKSLREDNFFEIAKSYPLGISRYSKEPVVRDPIMTNGEDIILVGDMDSSSIISLLKGDNDSLVDAAKIAAKNAIQSLEKDMAKNAVIVDCISRFLFLEEDFEKELINIKTQFPQNSQFWGVLTLGEIANESKENIEFYNKTCVVGAL